MVTSVNGFFHSDSFLFLRCNLSIRSEMMHNRLPIIFSINPPEAIRDITLGGKYSRLLYPWMINERKSNEDAMFVTSLIFLPLLLLRQLCKIVPCCYSIGCLMLIWGLLIVPKVLLVKRILGFLLLPKPCLFCSP